MGPAAAAASERGRPAPKAGPPPSRGAWRALGERGQRVAPVGAWVESAPGPPQAFASALRVEAALRARARERAAGLRRFQGDVRRRVRQRARLRGAQQLRSSREAVEKESRAALRCSAPAARSPRAGAIRSPRAPPEPFQQRAAELSKAVREVRRRLAACKTVSGASEAPGGARRDKPASSGTLLGSGEEEEEEEEEEFLLFGCHDLPAELQEQASAEREGDFCCRNELEKLGGGSGKDPKSPGSRVSLELWAGVDEEERKKQRQREFLRFRRLFMDLEREQVREQQRHKERQKRVAKIKSAKESERRAEERRLREEAPERDPERACEILARLELDERRLRETREQQRRSTERARYAEALRAQARERLRRGAVSLPPLCSCGADFWECRPAACANNCVFYRDRGAYGRALRSVVASCAPAEPRLPLRR